ncbi:hypothetical protein HF1_12990 [Mycoplasma haemofelis str. Langford 1]|uniref:Uncharacterized protein n=1 Tax=Mycoplasma haemofelis (strain Langford 1) TaxID=941640 RepID=E8ZJI6_MYCHL|nr:hypothetical protein [Mycoplasma haemofelis]CBY93307.1 hypothetical protein HF1_12990 [Mycoplasma haemofelis str. Langford 1]
MTLGSKIAAGVATSGTAVGGGFLAHSLISKEEGKKTLSKKLSEDGFTPLDTDVSKTDGSWQTIFDKYKLLTNQKAHLKIQGLTLGSSENQQEGIIKLKTECSKLLKIEEDSSDLKKNYQLASKWCVKPISVETLLKARGITYLDTSSNTEEWTKIAKRYESDKNAQKDTIMSDVTNWTTVPDNNYSANIKLIQDACNSRKTKNSYEEDFEKSLKETQSWCVVSSE